MAILVAALATLCFAYTLNLFLRGALKEAIGGALGLLILVVLIASFILQGWRFGLLALVGAFALMGISQPIARRAARRIMGHRTGIDFGDDGSDVAARLAKGDSLESVLSQLGRETQNQRQRLERLARQPAIASVLSAHRVSVDDFEKAFQLLWASGLQDLAWDIVSVPTDLDALLRMKHGRKSDAEIWAHFRQST